VANHYRVVARVLANKERMEKVCQQILRPTFTYMEGGPLAEI
jgi:hypothetical protein